MRNNRPEFTKLVGSVERESWIPFFICVLGFSFACIGYALLSVPFTVIGWIMVMLSPLFFISE